MLRSTFESLEYKVLSLVVKNHIARKFVETLKRLRIGFFQTKRKTCRTQRYKKISVVREFKKRPLLCCLSELVNHNWKERGRAIGVIKNENGRNWYSIGIMMKKDRQDQISYRQE